MPLSLFAQVTLTIELFAFESRVSQATATSARFICLKKVQISSQEVLSCGTIQAGPTTDTGTGSWVIGSFGIKTGSARAVGVHIHSPLKTASGAAFDHNERRQVAFLARVLAVTGDTE